MTARSLVTPYGQPKVLLSTGWSFWTLSRSVTLSWSSAIFRTFEVPRSTALGENMMTPAAARQGSGSWLAENGPGQLELLLRAVLYHSSLPVLIADDVRECLEASFGAGNPLGSPRDQILRRKIDDFLEPSFQPRVDGLWRDLLAEGRREGALPLLPSGGASREAPCAACSSVLHQRHLLIFQNGTISRKSSRTARTAAIPSWAKDIALLLLDPDRRLTSWYSGAARLFGHERQEAVGQRLPLLYTTEDANHGEPQVESTKAAAGGCFGAQGWRRKKNGSRF